MSARSDTYALQATIARKGTAMSHTPGPWNARKNAAFWEVDCLREGETEFNDCSPCVAHVWGIGDENQADGPTSAANAAYIVHAANAYPKLVQAMQALLTATSPANIGDEQQVTPARFACMALLGELGEAAEWEGKAYRTDPAYVYPKLVQALKASPGTAEGHALLRELGEL